ncbi:hypothetical protein [Phormidium sp. FACHB-1136]|jgi:hypothetical protein|uniref:hypothetical protein n=1 Tax=Phormidium sp. FACHB-1136 TaxID=2692848 RepID=UPI0016852811|nr:hypothetical protein [Phormidium sp. FACHB-1136]MBD2429374.1 hypothetical protein [Phormidium sp. FACHB-1136]
MATTPQPTPEPTLTAIAGQLEQVTQGLGDIKADVDQLSQQVERFNDRLQNYEQGMRWVVQLAFTLLISATVALVVSAITFLLRS